MTSPGDMVPTRYVTTPPTHGVVILRHGTAQLTGLERKTHVALLVLEMLYA